MAKPEVLNKWAEPSKCWNCKNAVPSRTHGCSWSVLGKPVSGWNAVQTVLYRGTNSEAPSYHIYDCPCYVEG